MLFLALIPIPYLSYLNVLSTIVSIALIFGIYLAYQINIGIAILI
ncbi:hypothetical protein [Staphylococcus shinii]|nr:hypothetical protein [Staphylococcus shinii]MDW8570479.1 hypothetical protein [Staphylococcus shinii]